MELEGFKRFLEGNVIDTSLLENARNEQQKKFKIHKIHTMKINNR